jgi:Na+-driven multidrug efflux pump
MKSLTPTDRLRSNTLKSKMTEKWYFKSDILKNNYPMIGFLTATDTMLAQSYGARQFDNYALWTGNSLVVIVPITLAASGAIALCGPSMKLFGQDHELANQAAEFSYRLLPGLLPYYLFKVPTKYLQSQNLLGPGVWIGILANGLNALVQNRHSSIMAGVRLENE